MRLSTARFPLDHGLRETIRSYDATAPAYSEKFQDVHLAEDEAAFMARLLSGLPVLDAGCGSGRDCRHLARAGCTVVGLDLSEGLLREARAMGHSLLVRADMRALPFQENRFSGVWSCASLLHLDDDGVQRALAEFQRVLVPGGALFVTVRAGSGTEWREDGFGGQRWHRFFEAEGLSAMMKVAGFRVLTVSTGQGSSAPGHWVSIHASSEEPHS